MSNEDNRNFEIQQGILQFMGAVIQDSNMSGKAAAQQAVARINEAALEMCKQKDDSYDLYVGKPILRGAAFLLKERIRQAKVAAKGANIIEFIAPLNDAIKIIENIANSIEPLEEELDG